MITHLLTYFSSLVFTTTGAATLLVGWAAYTATGLPEFHAGALAAMKSHILDIRDGQPDTRAQRWRNTARQLVPRLNPLTRTTTDDSVVWAYRISQVTADSQGNQVERDLLFQLLAQPHDATADEAFAMIRARSAAAASAMLTDFTAVFSSDDTLADAQRQWHQLETVVRNVLLQETFRSPEWRTLCAPVMSKFLDYTGRGASAGLIAGVMYTGSRQITDMVAIVGFTSLLGVTVSHLAFLGVTAELFKPRCSDVAPGFRWIFAHPVLAPIVTTLAIGTSVYFGAYVFPAVVSSLLH
ncbi:hypothetical protein ACQPW1_02070 [Nocardia sp. CA-128927]|uniref:hypothetical protein n=1 Tax=Nocardia sp. CA-128927 TaxID=3239975 RepID=UPI003D99BBA6